MYGGFSFDSGTRALVNSGIVNSILMGDYGMIIKIVILAFLFLELSNVIALYFFQVNLKPMYGNSYVRCHIYIFLEEFLK